MDSYRYIGNCAVPGHGTVGSAWPASGHDDPEDVEHEAWLFQPEGCEDAFYVDPARDLQALSRPAPTARGLQEKQK